MKRVDIQSDEVGWDDDQRLIVDGVPFTGEAVTYNWLDEVTSLATYVDGFRDGVQREWYDGRRPKSEMTVHNGESVGPKRQWDEDGRAFQVIRLAPQWRQRPLWVDGVRTGPAEFGLSAELAQRIEEWDAEFHLVQPAGFGDTRSLRRWLDQGRELAREIAPEVEFAVWTVRETIRRIRRVDVHADDIERDDRLRITYEGEPFTGELVDRWGDQLLALTTYHEGWPDGPSMEWYEDGTLRSEGMNRHSQAVGVHEQWHRNGRLAVEKRFDDEGHLVHDKHWDEEGNPVPFRRTGMPE